MMRELEDRIERKLYRQGKIVGGVYVGRGQEAIPVGTALLAGPDDIMLPSHRDQAVFLVRGVSPGRILAQYMGRVGGLTRGRDGNMHMGDMKHGIVSIISALAATVPVAAGVAMALRYQRQRTAWPSATSATAPPAAATGTRASISPPSRSSPWFSSVTTTSTRTPRRSACRWPAPTWPTAAPPTTCPPKSWTATTCSRSTQATRRAVDHARSGKGPYMLECKTFRMTGHSAHDAAHYVPQGLFEEWGKLDPIIRLKARMIDGRLGRPRRDGGKPRRHAQGSGRGRRRGPKPARFPDPATLLDDVYENQ